VGRSGINYNFYISEKHGSIYTGPAQHLRPHWFPVLQTLWFSSSVSNGTFDEFKLSVRPNMRCSDPFYTTLSKPKLGNGIGRSIADGAFTEKGIFK